MALEEKIRQVQILLEKYHLQGWLLYDFQGKNSLACQFLELPENTFLSRRFFFWIPQKGEPLKIVHGVEAHVLQHLPGKTKEYLQWESLDAILKDCLKWCKKIVM